MPSVLTMNKKPSSASSNSGPNTSFARIVGLEDDTSDACKSSDGSQSNIKSILNNKYLLNKFSESD